MDGPLRQSGRHGDALRTAHLLRRAGRGPDALEAFATLWAGDPSRREAAAAGVTAVLEASAPADRLGYGPALEHLVAAGFPGALAVRRRWFPAVDDLVGASSGVGALRRFLFVLAPTDEPVVLSGEPGTGRALAARTLHALSGRSGFCELYGQQRERRLLAELRERAPAGGTVYVSYVAPDRLEWLDAVQALCAARGARLLLGAVSPLDVEAAAFDLPALRERFDDLSELVVALLARAGVDVTAKQLGNRWLRTLRWHDWPGNVRELGNRLGAAVMEAPGDLDGIRDHVTRGLFGLPGEVGAPPGFKEPEEPGAERR